MVPLVGSIAVCSWVAKLADARIRDTCSQGEKLVAPSIPFRLISILRRDPLFVLILTFIHSLEECFQLVYQFMRLSQGQTVAYELSLCRNFACYA